MENSVKVISRKRNSGKTTMLLHYMVMNPSSILVSRTNEDCRLKRDMADKLSLDIEKFRFINLPDAQNVTSDNEFLIDDIDCLMEEDLQLVLSILKKASVVTLTKE